MTAVSAVERLDVRPNKGRPYILGLFGLFWTPLPLMGLYYALTEGDARTGVLCAAMLAPYCALVWFARPSHSKSIRFLSREGLVRNDGRLYPWADLERVVDRRYVGYRGTRRGLQRTELCFKGGEVEVFAGRWKP